MRVFTDLGHRIKACGLGLVLLGLAAVVAAAPSWFGRLNYQGQLTDDQGEPVSDGAYNVDFRIYDRDTGGTVLWSETQSVTVAKGLFNAVLGTNTPLNSLGSAVGDDLWIALDVNGNGEMVPRQQLLAAVYAFNARRLDGQPTGTAPYNIVQLDGTGKIPAGLVSGGSVSVPLDLSQNNGTFILRAQNTGAGIAISATTASGSLPAIYAEAPRYPAYFKTNNDSTGIAVRAASLDGYASLVDRPANAQVYGLATIASTLGVLGVNSNPSGTGVAGTGGQIGVSGTGGSYGVFGSSPNSVGVGGTGFYGVYGFTAQNSVSARGVFGQYTGTAAGIGVEGRNTANTAGAVGVQGVATGATAQVYGVRGEISSTSALAAGVYGRSNSNGGRAVRAEAAGNGVGLDASSALGTAVNAFGYQTGVNAFASNPGGTGVYGEGTYGVNGTVISANGAGVYAYSENGSSPAILASNVEGSGLAIKADGDFAVLSGSAATYGTIIRNNSMTGAAGDFYNVFEDQNAVGVSANAYGTGVVARTRYYYGKAVHAQGGYGVWSRGDYMSFFSDVTSNPYYGLYHSNSAAPSGSYGAYLRNEFASGYGAYIENDLPASSDSGYALRVKGKFQAPDCSGRVDLSSGVATTVWNVNSGVATVGTAGANCIESGSNVIITPITNLGTANNIYVDSVLAGSFRVRTAAAVTALSFYYMVINE